MFSSILEKAPDGDSRTLCPACSPNRTGRNKKIPTLSITRYPDKIVYNCWHCSETGVQHNGSNNMSSDVPTQPAKPPPKKFRQEIIKTLSPGALSYLETRGISQEVAIQSRVFSTTVKKQEVIGFNFIREDTTYAAKLRFVEEKRFLCEGSPRTFYSPGALSLTDDLYIVEGEMDALTFAEAGISNVVSIPNGATGVDNEKTWEYIEESSQILSKVSRVIIATDDDTVGNALRKGLVARIARRCWHVLWKKNVSDCKDANDYMVKYGKNKFLELVKSPTCPGIKSVSHVSNEVRKLYDGGRNPGYSTGYPLLDRYYTVAHSHLSVVTGIPNRGKSNFIDQVMINLATTYDKKFIICSMENDPVVHTSMLLEKHLKLPFTVGASERMDEFETLEGLAWLDEHFTFITDDEEPRLDSILERAEEIIRSDDIFGMVIDPYNYLARGQGESEYHWISDMLSTLRMFARTHKLHLWIVAHPRILREQRDGDGHYQVPRGYEISGSHAWFSKSDVGITVDVPQDGITQVHVWKCRYQWIGGKGVATLAYDKATGSYKELDLDPFSIEDVA